MHGVSGPRVASGSADYVNVAFAPYAADSVTAIHSGPELLTEVTDVHVDGPIKRLGRPPERTAADLVASYDHAGGPNEHLEDGEFGASEFDGLAATPNGPCRRIEINIIHHDSPAGPVTR